MWTSNAYTTTLACAHLPQMLNMRSLNHHHLFFHLIFPSFIFPFCFSTFLFLNITHIYIITIYTPLQHHTWIMVSHSISIEEECQEWYIRHHQSVGSMWLRRGLYQISRIQTTLFSTFCVYCWSGSAHQSYIAAQVPQSLVSPHCIP